MSTRTESGAASASARPAARYWAFISYSHADEAWARWLHRALETYRVPARLVGREHPDGPIPRRLFPVFRDRDELPSSHELGAVIQQALSQSRYLVVICSPQAARSRWVDEEIRSFKRLGREQRVLALIVDGEPHAADPERECFPAALKVNLADGSASEPIAADARPFADHKHGARLKLIAGMLGLGYDELVQRERVRRRWQLLQKVAVAAAAVAVLAGVWLRFEQREQQRAEEARLDRLVLLGQQELAQTRHARAAVYFHAALAGGRDTPALRYRLARALQPVDAVLPEAQSTGVAVIRAGLHADGDHLLLAGGTHLDWWSLQQGRSLRRVDSPLRLFAGRPRFTEDAGLALISGSSEPDGSMFATQTCVLPRTPGKPLYCVPGNTWAGAGARISPAGDRLLLEQTPPPREGGPPEVPTVVVRALDDGRVLAVLKAGQGTVTGSFSADGRWILTGGEGEGTLRIWDAQSYRLARTIQPRQRIAHSAYWTGRGQEILSINEAGAVKLYDGDSGELLDGLGSHRLFALAAEPAGQRWWLTSSLDGIKVWDLDSGRAVFQSEAIGGFHGDYQLSADGRFLIANSDRGRPALWDVRAGSRQHFLDVLPSAVAETLFSSDGERIIVVGVEGEIRQLSRAALQRPRARLAHAPYINPLEASGIGALITESAGGAWVSGGADGAVRRWDARALVALGALKAHDSAVTRLVEATEAGLIVSADSQGRIVAWDGHSAAPRWQVEAEAVASMVATAEHLLVLVDDHRLQWRRLVDGSLQSEQRLEAPLSQIAQLGGGRILLLGQDGTASLLAPSAEPGVVAPRLLFGGQPVSQVQIDPRSAQLLVATAEGGLRLHGPDAGPPQAELPAKRSRLGLVTRLALSRDGETIAAGTGSGQILLWHWPSDRSTMLATDGGAISELAFGSSDRLLASSDDSGLLQLWDVASGSPLDRLGLKLETITHLQFSPDGRHLAAVERVQDELQVWDVQLDTRSAEAIAQRLACAVPWRLQGLDLVAHRPDPAACAGATAEIAPAP
ncbi:MAG TPA: TIR domain-containing protein [Nevskiaceae bacterium]|nr:TIR domain-containing protein [Nevskiaceae bacterium]